jgi:hypothetical protein
MSFPFFEHQNSATQEANQQDYGGSLRPSKASVVHMAQNLFQSKQELREAVIKYCEYKAVATQDIACTNGYPIDRWDVSQIENMSKVL